MADRTNKLERLTQRLEPMRVPEPHDEEPGLFLVDATWGQITPITVAPGVRTVGELEVIEHLRQGRPIVDTRSEDSFATATIPGATNAPPDELDSLGDRLDPAITTVFFCNGPQCPASPRVIGELLERSRPPASILYYRGGLHDWLTLGLPVAAGR